MLRGRTRGETARHQERGGGVQERRSRETARHQDNGGGVQEGRPRETARHQEGSGGVQGVRTMGEAGGHPEEGDVLTGRTRGETARNREAMGHGLLSLMAGREGIGYVPFHRAPPRENHPLPTRPASELSTPNSYVEACVDEYSTIWRQAMGKEYHGLADAGTFGAT